MSDKPNSRPDDPLRMLLRAGDPLAGEAPPSPTQIAVWRQALREASRRPSRRPAGVRGLLPALGVAGAIVLAAILIVRSGGERPTPDRVARMPSPPAPPAMVSAPEPAPDPTPEPAEPPPLPRSPIPAPAAGAARDIPPPAPRPAQIAKATPPAVVTAPDAPSHPQALQFTAANGTRILWILDPKLNL